MTVPETTQDAPQVLAPGETISFTVQVQTLGEEVTGVTLVMAFDQTFLEVVDTDIFEAGVQIQEHEDNPLKDFKVENIADNVNGTIRFTFGDPTPVSGTFDLAIITFTAKDDLTPAGSPTEVVFLVDDSGSQTSAGKSGDVFLGETSDYVGAYVQVGGS